MNIEQMLAVLDPEIVSRLKTAIEIGKWPNGVALTKEQRQTCMQAVYAWEAKNLLKMNVVVILTVARKKKMSIVTLMIMLKKNLSQLNLFKVITVFLINKKGCLTSFFLWRYSPQYLTCLPKFTSMLHCSW